MAAGDPRTTDPKQKTGDSAKDDQQESNVFITTLVFRLVKNCILLVLRFYIMMILVAYEWSRKLVTSLIAPFEPIIVQVRKVPKKDISLEGIFYQFLRIYFLIFLYMTPMARSWVSYSIQPLTRLKSWAEDFVGFDEKTRRVEHQS